MKSKHVMIFCLLLYILTSCSSAKKGTYCEFSISSVDLRGVAKNIAVNQPVFINELNGEEYSVVFKDTSLRSWPDSCVNKQVLVYGFSFLENKEMILKKTTFVLYK